MRAVKILPALHNEDANKIVKQAWQEKTVSENSIV